MRASKKIAAQVPNGIDPYCKIKTSSQDQMKEPDLQIDLDETSGMPDNSFCLRKMRKFKPSNPMLRKSSVDDMTPRSSADQNNKESGPILINEDEDMIYPSSYVQEYSFESLRASIDGVYGSLGDHAKHPPPVIDDEVMCYGDSSSIQTSFHIRKETSVPVAQGNFFIYI